MTQSPEQRIINWLVNNGVEGAFGSYENAAWELLYLVIGDREADPAFAKVVRYGWPSDEVRDAVEFGVSVVERCEAGYECRWVPSECQHKKIQHLIVNPPPQ